MNLYNEIDDYCCNWLENLIRAKLIPEGVVDRRDIRDILPRELARYRQCHFFVGLGGWPLALATAGVDPDRPLWTGSCPCQPFSAAGKQRGFADERHLWPYWHHLVAQCCPSTILGEQVASATEWLRLVRGDLEALGYAVGAIPIEAASAGSYASGDRFWFVAKTDRCDRDGRHSTVQVGRRKDSREVANHDFRKRTEWPAQSPVPLLAYGVSARMERCSAFGNAIDPRPAAEFIRAALNLP